jgi:hypothetical protein
MKKRRKNQKKITEKSQNTEKNENTIVTKKKDYGIIKSETKSPQSHKNLIKMDQAKTKKWPQDGVKSKYFFSFSLQRDIPAIYQREQVQSCTNAASTSIISGGKWN